MSRARQRDAGRRPGGRSRGSSRRVASRSIGRTRRLARSRPGSTARQHRRARRAVRRGRRPSTLGRHPVANRRARRRWCRARRVPGSTGSRQGPVPANPTTSSRVDGHPPSDRRVRQIVVASAPLRAATGREPGGDRRTRSSRSRRRSVPPARHRSSRGVAQVRSRCRAVGGAEQALALLDQPSPQRRRPARRSRAGARRTPACPRASRSGSARSPRAARSYGAARMSTIAHVPGQLEAVGDEVGADQRPQPEGVLVEVHGGVQAARLLVRRPVVAAGLELVERPRRRR